MLTKKCELIYLRDKPYAPKAEGGLNAFDPMLGIAWPLDMTQMSARDRGFAMFMPES